MTDMPPLPENDERRLQQLHALGVLDTDAEPLYDALTKVAAKVVGVPIALISVIDANRQWFESNTGLAETSETSRDAAFYAHTIAQDGVLEIPDTHKDPRFKDNPLVTDAPGIRFYAGAPITLRGGIAIGSLCVMDHAPRTLDDSQRAVLTQLANAAAEAMQQRATADDLASALRREADAERRLGHDRSRLAHIVEATGAGTWEWNIQTGEVHIDQRWAQILGYQLGELGDLSAKKLFDRIHPHDFQESSALMRRHFSGESDAYDCEVRIRHRDGRWIWVHGQGRVVSRTDDGAPQWMFGMHRDITERKQTQLALESSRAFLDRTGQMAGVGGWEVDLLTREVTWSNQTCRIHDEPIGYQPTLEQAIDYYEPESRVLIGDAVRRGENDGSSWDLELSIRTAKDRQIWVRATGAVEFDALGVPVKLAGAVQDITMRRRAVASLELSERRFRKLFQYSLGLICTHDLNGIILSVNPALANSIGYPMAELMGRRLSDLMRPELSAAFDEYLQRIVANSTDSGLLQLIAADGCAVSWQYHNVIDDEGDEPYVLAHAQDITERLRQEKQLREWSIRDTLTGCFNRRFLSEMESAMTRTDAWGCIAVDLDRFKQVNDTYGHQRGDEVLVAMAQFLSQHIRDGDVVIRVGGDEFVIMLKGADEETTQDIKQRILDDVDHAPIRFTLGHSVRSDDMALDALLAKADKRLYESRAARRRSA